MDDLANVLGIWDGHDAGVALVRNGELVFALSEERLVRRKRASGFPYMALEACLNYCNLDPTEISAIAVPGRYGRLLHRVADKFYRNTNPNRDPLSLSSSMVRTLETGIARIPGMRDVESLGSRSVLVSRLRRLGITAPIHWVEHHDAHAVTASLGGLENALVVTMDGYGDGLCGTFRGPGLEREVLPSPAASIALVYGAVTRTLGFGEGDEGKVMGLAASGDPSLLRAYFEEVIGDPCDPRLGGRTRRRGLAAFRAQDVAAALQARVETVVTDWVKQRKNGFTNLALAGGLFANVALNGRLAREFEQIYVFPHMGDGGLCVGAAAAFAPIADFGLPFYGPIYTNQHIENAVKRAGLVLEAPVSPEAELWDSIQSGGLAARFTGRSEFGPRALGHRSILLRADRPELADQLNNKLGRDEFMPFAPIRRTGIGSSTMTVVYDADSELIDRCPAAVHVDGTVRTQLIDATRDPGIDALLRLAEKNGHPALINTSFNRHGEPIVETPEHAIDTFLAAELDILQIGPFIVRRPM